MSYDMVNIVVLTILFGIVIGGIAWIISIYLPEVQWIIRKKKEVKLLEERRKRNILESKKMPLVIREIKRMFPDVTEESLQEYMNLFCSEPASEYAKEEGFQKSFRPWILTEKITPLLDSYILQHDCNIPNIFFDDLLRVVAVFIKTDGNDMNMQYIAVMKAQIMAVIMHPRFISDQRIMPILEELRKMGGQGSYWEHIVTEYVGSGKTKFKKGFSIKHLPAFERMINNPILWEDEKNSYGKGNFTNWFFRDIIRGINILAKDYPAETLNARIQFVKQMHLHNTKFGCITIIQYYEYLTDYEVTILKSIVADSNSEKWLVEYLKNHVFTYNRTHYAA